MSPPEVGHLIIPLPAAVKAAVRDADPALSAYVSRLPLGWGVLILGPILAVIALPAGVGSAVGVGLLGSAVVFGLLLAGHARHRRAVESDSRTPELRSAHRLVTDFNALAPRLEALSRSPTPDTAELFSEARRLRLDIQGIIGAAQAAVDQQPRLGQAAPRRSRLRPMTDDARPAAAARIAAIAARLTEAESPPSDVLRFPRKA